MNNLSNTTAEEAIVRYYLALFRDAVKIFKDIRQTFDHCSANSCTENRLYPRFCKKYPNLPPCDDQGSRDWLINAMWPTIYKQANDEGVRLLGEAMVRNIGEEKVKGFLSGKGLMFRTYQKVGCLWVVVLFSGKRRNCIEFGLDYKKLHEPGVLDTLLNDIASICIAINKYGDSVIMHSEKHYIQWER